MIIAHLKLRNFRNYEALTVSFAPGLNLIAGANASGKTNLVEAMYYLSLARSFRTSTAAEMIKEGCEYAVIEATILKGESKKSIRATIDRNGRTMLVNDKEIKRLSELADVANVLVFEPRDVHLFREGPKGRRNYLDIHLSKINSFYLEAMTRYGKLLEERNEILRQDKHDEILRDSVETLMGECGFVIYKARCDFIERLQEIINKILKAISNKPRVVNLQYVNSVQGEDKNQYAVNLKKAFKKSLESDLRYKVTSIGIHREDFVTLLNGQKIAVFGSQGERRMVALALKVAPYFLIERQVDRPIVILDDVLSELDEEHAQRLLAFFEKFEQVFITGTKFAICNASYYEVVNQNIRRTSYGR